MIKNVTLGSDPEVFLVDEKDSSRFISAIGKIGGSKDFPIAVENGISLQEDCTAVEFCIPPSKTAEEFSTNIQNGLLEIVKKVTPMGLNLAVVASAHFTKEELNHPIAMMGGCDPDYCVWSKEMNEPPNLRKTTLRVAGAHVHIGYDNPSEETNFKIIKALDLFLGVPSVLMDDDKERKTLYGKAGCFRHKEYGVEYRTLSNFWLKDEALIQWVFNNTMKALTFINEQQEYLLDNYQTSIITAINENNVKIAESLTREFNIPVKTYVEQEK